MGHFPTSTSKYFQRKKSPTPTSHSTSQTLRQCCIRYCLLSIKIWSSTRINKCISLKREVEWTIKHILSRVWQLTHAILAHRKQDCCKFEANLVEIASSKPARVTKRDSLPKNKQTNRSFTMEEFLGKGRGKTDLQIKRIQIKSFLK